MSWRHQPVGERFRYRYHQHRNRGLSMRIAMVGIGLLMVLVGLPLIPLPGPGWVMTIGGLGLIGGEFHRIATFLDTLDERVFDPIIRFSLRHPLVSMLVLWIFAIGTVYLSWVHGPSWDYGPIYWGDFERTVDALKRIV